MICSVDIRELDRVAIIELAGKFTLGDSSGLIRGAVNQVLAAGKRDILLDLSRVTYLDSAAGIGELVSSYTTATCKGAQLKLLRPGKNVDRVLTIVGLHKIFDIYDDEASAVRSFESRASATQS